MIRQLATPDFRLNIKRVSSEKALIIGDPLLNNFINQLPGAEKEARVVQGFMAENGYAHTAVISKSADEVVRTLFCDDYKIIHLAGHGVFNAASPKKSGMVIGNDTYLTTFDIAQMSAVPELVFVNCCHLGKVNGVDEQYFQERYKLAANIGTQLIECGVKAVVAAGWAVSDEAASEFAEIFYTRMFSGSNFGDAVKDARAWIYDKYHLSNNTWGAYQCYGDPFYKLINRSSATRQTGYSYMMAQEAAIDLGNLKSDLDTRGVNLQQVVNKLQQISDAVDAAEIRNPEITEGEAFIHAELCNYHNAIEKLESLFAMEKADFSVLALEKYCNLRCRHYVQNFFDGKQSKLGSWEEEVENVIKNLRYLLLISPTAERYALLGSAWKRKAVVCDPDRREEALMAAAYYYYVVGTKEKTPSPYAFANWCMLESVILYNKNQAWGEKEIIKVNEWQQIPGEKPIFSYERPSFEEAMAKLAGFNKAVTASSAAMNYWNLADISNITLCGLMSSRSEDKLKWKALLNNYIITWNKAGSPGKKRAEIENIQILAYVLQTDSPLKQQLLQLREQLEKLIAV